MSTKGKPQTAVGGQAIIEGVLMRTPFGVAIALRKQDGSIVVRDRPWRSLTRKIKPLGWPLLRGMIVLVESLKEGIDGLRFSAEVAMEDEEAAAAAGDRGSANFSANLALVLGIVFALLIFKGVPHAVAILTGLDPTQTMFHVVDGVVKLALVIGYITAISRMKDIQRVFQYHGAEHKSIRAFEQGADLTVEETKPFTRLHERCGTSFLIVVVVASMLVYIAASPLIPRDVEGGWLFQIGLVFAKILLLGPVAAISYEINRLAGTYWKSPFAKIVAWPGLLMQKWLTTREPSEDQLEVALAALRSALVFSPTDESRPWRLRSFENFDVFQTETKSETHYTPDQPEAA